MTGIFRDVETGWQACRSCGTRSAPAAPMRHLRDAVSRHLRGSAEKAALYPGRRLLLLRAAAGGSDAEYCPACRAKKHAYTQGRALYLYTDAVRESLHAVKYHNKREYLEYYAREMAEHLAEAWKTWQPQVMIPIPMHPSACRKRGYNQAEILAKELGRILGIPVRCDVLKKVRKTASQKELDYRARQSNLKGAFAVAEKYMHSSRREGGLQGNPARVGRCLPWERVLLVDDIYTTGSTVHEAAVVLKNAGIKCVYFVTICAVPENS